MAKLSMPVICDCGFNTMDAKEAVEHIRKHDNELCPVCGAHKLNYMEVMGEECLHGHGELVNDNGN